VAELNKPGPGTKPRRFDGGNRQGGTPTGGHFVRGADGNPQRANPGDIAHLTDAQAFALRDRFVEENGTPIGSVPSGGPTGTGGQPQQPGQPAGGVTNPTPGNEAGTAGQPPQSAPTPPAK
jgi:hypothetical protein